MAVLSLLSEIGFKNLVSFENGLEVFNYLEQGKGTRPLPGLIIADWNMPVMSGLSLLVVLKSSPRFSQIPFLMITGDADVGLVTLAVSSGVDEFVVKPLTEDKLREKLEVLQEKYFKL